MKKEKLKGKLWRKSRRQRMCRRARKNEELDEEESSKVQGKGKKLSKV
jgi:hypothetical protein